MATGSSLGRLLWAGVNQHGSARKGKLTQVGSVVTKVSYFYPLSSMVVASQVLSKKHLENVCTIEKTATILDALRSMKDNDVGALLVTQHDVVKGIFTERDYLTKVVVKGLCSRDAYVSQVMTRKVICVDPAASLDQCLQVLSEEKFRHLPVVDSDAEKGFGAGTPVKDVKGMFSVRDILHYLRDIIEATSHSVYFEEISNHVDKSIEAVVQTRLVSVLPSDSVRLAVERMVEAGVGWVATIDESGDLVGVFTEKDYRSKVMLENKDSRTVTVGELIDTKEKFTAVTAQTSVRDVVNIMVDRNMREIPVVSSNEEGKPVKCSGFVTITDILQAQASI
eukprot:CFRG3979T1